MVNKFETGHSKNVTNFERLIITLEGFGEKYNPSNESITLPALCDKEASSRDALNTLNELQPLFTRALSNRDEVVEPIGKLARRIVNALKSSGAPQKTIEAAKSLSNKINGTKRPHIKTEATKEGDETDEKIPREISTAQTSIDRRLDNFSRLIKLLEVTPEYNPNEEELKTESLNTLCELAGTLNMEAIKGAKKMSNLRIERDRELYDKQTGLFAAVTAVKLYLRSIFEVNSSEYKQITSLQFTNKKI